MSSQRLPWHDLTVRRLGRSTVGISGVTIKEAARYVADHLVLGVALLALGLSILTQADKRVEAYLVKHSPAWLTDLTTRY